METSTGRLCGTLLAKLKNELTSALCADILLLSASDAAFLTPSESAGAMFAEAWPVATALDGDDAPPSPNGPPTTPHFPPTPAGPLSLSRLSSAQP